MYFSSCVTTLMANVLWPRWPQGHTQHTASSVHNLDNDDLLNYRPISHLSFLSKLFERVVKDCLTHHLLSHGLLNTCQSVYTGHLSTESTLLSVDNHVLIKSIWKSLRCLLQYHGPLHNSCSPKFYVRSDSYDCTKHYLNQLWIASGICKLGNLFTMLCLLYCHAIVTWLTAWCDWLRCSSRLSSWILFSKERSTWHYATLRPPPSGLSTRHTARMLELQWYQCRAVHPSQPSPSSG